MNYKYLFSGLLAVAFGAGCTQQKTAQSNKDRVYYHDRRVAVGSNIPRSYSDSASTNTSSQSNLSDTNQQELLEMQRTSGNQMGGVPSGGGGR